MLSVWFELMFPNVLAHKVLKEIPCCLVWLLVVSTTRTVPTMKHATGSIVNVDQSANEIPVRNAPSVRLKLINRFVSAHQALTETLILNVQVNIFKITNGVAPLLVLRSQGCCSKCYDIEIIHPLAQ